MESPHHHQPGEAEAEEVHHQPDHQPEEAEAEEVHHQPDH